MQTTTAGSRDLQHSGESLALSNSNSNNNNDDSDSKRRKATQACDYCRQKRTKCDNVKPRCHQCSKAGILCTFFTHSKKRGPIPREELDPEARQAAIDHASGRQIVKPKPTRNIGPLQLTHYENLRPRFNTLRNFYPPHHSYFGNQSDDPMRRLTEEGHTPSIEASSIRPASARGDLWRKELTDHLVDIFFEHCFQDFDNFDPKEFLKDYAERKVNPSLLNAICAVAARFSDHPDIAQVPPYLSGEPYAEKTREKIMDLIDEATISNLHVLSILSFYEYSAWSGPRGWRFGGLASRMGIELYLHNQRDIPTSEAARVKFETKCRTFWNLIHIDIFSAASAGLPSILDVKLYNIQLPDYRPDWWVEKHKELEAAIIGEVEEDSDIQETISTQPETTPKDPFAARILAKLQETRRLRGHGPAKYLFEPIELLFHVSHYINGNSLESDKCPSDSSSEFAILEGRLSVWIKTIEEEVPLTPKELVESDENVAYMILTYYMTVIMLHRPIIALENVVDTSFVDQSRARCAEAATKITEIVEQFNEIDIKYRGHLFVFQVFTGAAIHVTNIFSSDDALAANAKRCLNVHLNFLKVSSPHWTVSARLYFILQDLYSGQVTVNAQSDSSTATSAAATPQGRSGAESRSDKASFSGAGHSPMSVSLESVRIDHTSDHQDGSDANTALSREQPLMMPPGSTTSSMVNATTFDDSRGDGASVQGSPGIGFDHEDEADQSGSTTFAGSSATKRPSKKAKKMSSLSHPILPRPLIPGTSITHPAPEESMTMAGSISALATSTMAPHQGAASPTITSTAIMVPPEHLSLPPPQPPLQPLPLQVSAWNNRHQPLPIHTSLHSLDTPLHLLPDLEFIDSHSLEKPMSTLLPPHHGLHSHSQGQAHQPLQIVYPQNISSGQTAIPISNESPSSSSFNLYEQSRTPPLTSRRVSMPFNPISEVSAIDASSRGYSGQLTYAPPPPPPPHWNVEVVGSYAPDFETYSRASPSVYLPPPSLHSHPGLLRSSSSPFGAAPGGGEGVFSAGIPTSSEWIMDQNIMFGSRTTPWLTGIVHERVGAREGMIEYQNLQDKQQEYMSTRFMRQLPVVDLGPIQPPLTTLALDPQPGEYGISGSGGGGSTVGMHLFAETSSSAGMVPFIQQQQQPEQQQQQQQATHLQYPVHGSVMQPPIQRLFQLQAPQHQQQHPHQHPQQQQQQNPPQIYQEYYAQMVSEPSQSYPPPLQHPPPPHY